MVVALTQWVKHRKLLLLLLLLLLQVHYEVHFDYNLQDAESKV